MTTFVGHTGALCEVETAFASGRMPHAWLIAGIEGIGKAAFAKRMARLALCSGEDDPALKLVEAETHPDLLIVRRASDEKTGALRAIIPVEDVQKIAPFLHKTATHNGWRVVIVDEAHTLNRFGQNAILKIVEEPPPRTLILMTVTTPGALLPTIRSRARTLPLSPLSSDNIREILASRPSASSPEDIEAVLQISGGSIGFAMKILRTQTLPLYRDMLSLLDSLPELDIARLHKLADQIGRKADAESFDVITTLLIERLCKATQDEAKKQPSENIEVALHIWDKTRATFEAAQNANLDKKLAFINAVCDIRTVMNSTP